MINGKVGKVYISESQIQKRIKELAEKIEKDFPVDEDLIVVGLLKGSFMFLTDLVKEMRPTLIVDFMTAASYGEALESSKEVKILKDIEESIMGKNVLLVEDIIDSGYTLSKVVEILKGRSPKSIKICTLLNKFYRREVEVTVDYVGFDVADYFVFGYGIDIQHRYRHLKDIEIFN
ncbi:MAG: hypoxanthine phosphoribosyltransferase [Fusobacteria bacterium]|nr:hypoxanthine phosphoribosyltransferase [Fusobacteriota bacterium]